MYGMYECAVRHPDPRDWYVLDIVTSGTAHLGV